LAIIFDVFPDSDATLYQKPNTSKHRTISSNRTFQYIAVYLPALAIRRPSVRYTGKISTDKTSCWPTAQADGLG